VRFHSLNKIIGEKMTSIWKWFFVCFLFCGSTLHAVEQAHVAVGQIVEHLALDTLRKGLKEGLEAKGYVEGEI
jgi:ABC-type uncharacterized transport system substrate-binding protein